MVTRGAPVLVALLLVGCPDDFGRGAAGVPVGLVAPAALAGVPNGGSQVVLTWTDLATTETGYRLEMNDSPFGSPTIADVRFLPAQTTTYVYPTLPNQTYYFRVVAITAMTESDPSGVAVVHTPDVPVQVAGLVVATASSSRLDLSWTDVANETGYRIYQSADGGGSWSLLFELTTDASAWPISGLAPDTTYAFRIIAWNANGDATPSEPASGLTATGSMTFTGIPHDSAFPSCAVSPGGMEHVSHCDATTTNVFVSSRVNGGAFTSVLADGGTIDVGVDGTSIALDGAGITHVVAHNQTNHTLRYATNAGGIWISGEVASGGGARPRIACHPADGSLHVVYQSKPSAGMVELRHAMKPPGQPWTVSSLSPGLFLADAVHSIALDDVGALHVLLGTSNGWLYWIRKATPALGGTTGQQILVPDGPPDFTSLAIDAAGTIHGFYRDAVSRSLHHVSRSGSNPWLVEVVHGGAGEDLGKYCSAAVHPATGRLHVAYYDAVRGDLRYARKDPGGAWVLRIVDVAGDVGAHAAVAVDASGVVHIAYRDQTNRVLKVAVGSP